MFKEGKMPKKKRKLPMILFFSEKYKHWMYLLERQWFVGGIWLMRGETKGNSPFDLIRIPSSFCTLLDKGCPV